MNYIHLVASLTRKNVKTSSKKDKQMKYRKYSVSVQEISTCLNLLEQGEVMSDVNNVGLCLAQLSPGTSDKRQDSLNQSNQNKGNSSAASSQALTSCLFTCFILLSSVHSSSHIAPTSLFLSNTFSIHSPIIRNLLPTSICFRPNHDTHV